MADVISTFASPVVEIAITKLAGFLTTEFLAFINVKDDLMALRDTLANIRELLGVLEIKRTNPSKDMNNWLKNLQVAAYDAGDLIESWEVEYHQWMKKKQVRALSLPFSASKFQFQYKESRDLREIKVRIEKILHDGQIFRNIIGNPLVPRSESLSRQTGSLSNNIVEGRGDDVDNIIKLLIPDEGTSDEGSIAFIPIVGMGGLGKTTLAQLVYNHERVEQHFKRKFWVCVTQNYDKTRILKGMLESNKSIVDPNITFEMLQDRVLELVREKRFLLVLDDLWNNNYMELEPLENLLRQGVSGSKVLVTSRNNEVWKITGAKSSYALRHFDDNESQSLFEKIAFEGRSLPDELKEYANPIVKKCNGLPLAVKQMGGMLRGITDASEWKYVARSEMWELQNDKVLPALRLSYNLLSSALKQCFAYCSLFPKAYVFERNELVKLWIAEGFIHPHDRHRTEDIGRRYFRELSDRFFFETSGGENESKYRMHDLIHDLAQFISTPFFCQVKDIVPQNFDEVSRHVSLISNEVEKPLSEIIRRSKKLRTLLLPVKQVKAFERAERGIFHSLMYMRTLDLSSSTLQELSASIENLKLLHYLDLSKTEIKKLPDSICNLYHLETLKLLGCPWLFNLPKKLKALLSLRHLELDELFWYRALTIPERMGCVTNLHNLHKFEVGHNTGYKLEELKNMKFLTGSLHILNLENAVDAGEANLKEKEMLENMVYEWSSNDSNLLDEAAKQVLEDLEPHPNVNQIQVCHYRSTDFPTWMRFGQLKNLVSVCLKNCTKIKILSLGDLPNLRELNLKMMLDMMEWTEEIHQSVSSLKISGCPKLTKLPPFFPRLRSMKIKGCGLLETIPVGPVQFIRLANNPVLKHWTEVTLITINVVDGYQTRRRSSNFLLEANITNCPELETLPAEFYPQKLEVSGCKKLSSLPDINHATRLQVLALDACHDETLVSLIPSSGNLYSLVISKIPNLICLPKWPSFQSLQAFYVRDCADLKYLSNREHKFFEGCNSLKHLSISNCPNLVTLPAEGLPTSLQVLSIGPCASLNSFGPMNVLAKLTSLTDLYIEDCPALQSLPVEGLSASLQHLSIKGCPSLIRGCGEKGSDWLKIKETPDLDIEMPPTEIPCSSPSTAWYYLSRNRKVRNSKGNNVSE